jgi:serine/threonine protein kinase
MTRSSRIGSPTSAPTEKDNQEPHLSLLSGQSYSDIICGRDDSGESTPQTSNIPTKSPKARQANSPYIIGFHDAFIDPEFGAISLVLEFMNGGSIQDSLDSGKRYNEDSVAILAFSVLSALVELHSRNILHRDVKPSNILTDSDGRIKLTDFGITKGDLLDLLVISFLE